MKELLRLIFLDISEAIALSAKDLSENPRRRLGDSSGGGEY